MSIRLGRNLTLQAAAGGTVRFAHQWRDSAGGLNPAVALVEIGIAAAAWTARRHRARG